MKGLRKPNVEKIENIECYWYYSEMYVPGKKDQAIQDYLNSEQSLKDGQNYRDTVDMGLSYKK